MLILFDFDGTLADTAPDLAAAADLQRTKRGLAPLPQAHYRPHASHGARGLLKVALDLDPDDPAYPQARDDFLRDYARNMTRQTALFPGIAGLLDTLHANGHAWGIVTNKAERLAFPLIAHLGLASACAVAVGGDTTPHPKPHPAPLLHAARTAGFDPSQCLYVGDDQRDIIAGKAAGMPTVAAAYGYCLPSEVAGWGADRVAESPDALWEAIQTITVRGNGWPQGMHQDT